MKNSSDTIWDRTSDLLICSAVLCIIVPNYTAAAAICMVTCLTARNADNIKHEDGVYRYVLWGVTVTLRGVMFLRDESLDNSVCRRVTHHRNPEDRDTGSLRNDGCKLPFSYG
jgi:hypothetical protein